MAWAADSPPWALSMLSMMALRSPWLEATMTSSSRSPANDGAAEGVVFFAAQDVAADYGAARAPAALAVAITASV